MLCEKWQWANPPELTVDPQRRKINRKRLEAASGATTDYLYNIKREFKAKLAFMDPADAAIWENAFRERHIENSEPFAAKWDQIWPDPILWKNVPPEFSLPVMVGFIWKQPILNRLDGSRSGGNNTTIYDLIVLNSAVILLGFFCFLFRYFSDFHHHMPHPINYCQIIYLH